MSWFIASMKIEAFALRSSMRVLRVSVFQNARFGDSGLANLGALSYWVDGPCRGPHCKSPVVESSHPLGIPSRIRGLSMHASK